MDSLPKLYLIYFWNRPSSTKRFPSPTIPTISSICYPARLTIAGGRPRSTSSDLHDRQVNPYTLSPGGSHVLHISIRSHAVHWNRTEAETIICDSFLSLITTFLKTACNRHRRRYLENRPIMPAYPWTFISIAGSVEKDNYFSSLSSQHSRKMKVSASGSLPLILTSIRKP